MENDVERAAALEARGRFQIAEVDRDGDADLLVRVDPVQVEVPGIIRHRMHVHDLGDDRLGLIAILQGDQVALQLAGLDSLAELIGLDGDGNRILAAAVQHARDLALATGGAGTARARTLADFDVQNDIGHGPASKRSRRADAARRRMTREGSKGAANYTKPRRLATGQPPLDGGLLLLGWGLARRCGRLGRWIWPHRRNEARLIGFLLAGRLDDTPAAVHHDVLAEAEDVLVMGL